MTHSSRVGRRYAAALFHTAQRQGVTENVAEDLRLVRDFLRGNPQVLAAFAFPRVPLERKKAVLRSLLDGNLREELTQRFLDLVLDHGREEHLEGAAEAFAQLMDESRNVVAADVRSAAPLDDEQAARVKRKLDALTGRDVRMTVSTDPSLVGGLVVRIGDRILDGSVKGYLEQFESRLRNAPLAAISLEDIPTA